MRPAGNSNTRKPEARATLLGRCYHDSRQDRALGPNERGLGANHGNTARVK